MPRVLITGATGFLGRSLSDFLLAKGYNVIPMTRGVKNVDGFGWDIQAKEVYWNDAKPVDAVVHLAGESVAEGRWNHKKKQRILQSRVQGTQLLAEFLAALPVEKRPRTFVCASGMSYYGDQGDEILTEDSPKGSGFLSDVTQAWEGAADAAVAAGIRVVYLRTSVVLGSSGGALKKMLTPVKLGVGGKVGDGQQWFSWIGRDDWVHAACHVLENFGIAGPVNMVHAQHVRQEAFMRTLCQHLSRPCWFFASKFAVSLALGSEKAQELLLASLRVKPQTLLQHGFEFEDSDLKACLSRYLPKE